VYSPAQVSPLKNDDKFLTADPVQAVGHANTQVYV
jgi:hypothetical protein